MKTKTALQKILSVFLAAVMLAGLVGVSVLTVGATNEPYLDRTGQCGDNVYWTFDSATGMLTLTGSGATWDNFDTFSANSDGIVTVSVAEGITVLGDGIFSMCRDVKHITLPNSLVEIRNSAFADMSSLESVEIPDSVKAIGASAFSNCTELEEINIPSGIETINDLTFKGCASLTCIDIPDSVQSIGSVAFSDCINLAQVSIPDSVKRIYSHAFSGCAAMSDIVLPDSLEYLGLNAFSDTAFYSGCDADIIYIGSVLTECKNTSLTDIDVKDGTAVIAEGAFNGCGLITSVTLPDTVRYIPYNTFSDTALYMDCEDDILYIGKYLIEVLNKEIENVTVRDGTLLIAEKAFHKCNKINSVTTPQSLKYINGLAFSDTIIDTVEISSGVESIDLSGKTHAFSGSLICQINVDPQNRFYCSDNGVLFDKNKTELLLHPALSSDRVYKVPVSVKKIGAKAFEQNFFIKNISLPYGLEQIGDKAFELTTGLESLTIPYSVEDIGSQALFGSGLKKLEIPEISGKIGKNITDFCYNIEIISINNKEFIGQLKPCCKLKQLTVGFDDTAVQTDKCLVHFNGENLYKYFFGYIEVYTVNELTGSLYETADLINTCCPERIDTYIQSVAEINSIFSENFSTSQNDITASLLEASVLSLLSSAVEGADSELTVYCNPDSEQHTYCIENDIEHKIIGSEFDCKCGIHDIRTNGYYAPTCIRNGYVGGSACVICEKVYEVPEIIPATGEHKDKNGDGCCDVCNQWLEKGKEPTFLERVRTKLMGIIDVLIALFRRLFG